MTPCLKSSRVRRVASMPNALPTSTKNDLVATYIWMTIVRVDWTMMTWRLNNYVRLIVRTLLEVVIHVIK